MPIWHKIELLISRILFFNFRFVSTYIAKNSPDVYKAHFEIMPINYLNDRYGGIFASQVIRLIGNIYSQTMHIYICGGLYRI